MRVLTVLVGFIASILTLSSCQKTESFDSENCTGDCYIIRGKVTDSANSQGISKVQLKILFNRVSSHAGKAQVLANVTTDNEGNYAVAIDGKQYQSQEGYYSIEANHSVYFLYPYKESIARVVNFTEADINKPKEINFSMFYPAYMKIHVRAQRNTNFSSLSFLYNYNSGGYGLVLNGNRAIDTVLTFKTAADIPTYVKWNTLGGKVHQEKKDVLKAGRTEVTEYSIDL